MSQHTIRTLFFIFIGVLFTFTACQKKTEEDIDDDIVEEQPDAFSFESASAEPLETVQSEGVTLSGFNGSLPIEISGHSTAGFSINGSKDYLTVGSVKSGDVIRLRVTPISTDTNIVVDISVGEMVQSWSVSVLSENQPDDFSFKNASVKPLVINLSEEVTLSGFEGILPIKITGHPEAGFSIKGKDGFFKEASVKDGDVIRLAVMPNLTDTDIVLALTVDKTVRTWSVSIIIAQKPDPFSFKNISAKPRITEYSEEVTLSGFEGLLPVRITGHRTAGFNVKGDSQYYTSKSVRSGDVISLKVTPFTTDTIIVVEVTVGNVIQTWSVSVVKDLEPDFFAFKTASAEPLETVQSEGVTLSGFDSPLPIRISGHDTAVFSINGSDFITNGSVKSGDIIRLRVIPTSTDNNININVTIGDVTKIWSVSVNHKLTEEESFNLFMNNARFLPSDPREMTADDKNWFSNNSIFNIKWVLEIEGSKLSDEQERNAQLYIDGALKTLNYVVYTKVFARSIKAMFDNKDNYVSVSTDPNENPTALGTILVLRSLNTSMAINNTLVFRITKQSKRGIAYTALTSPISLDVSTDLYSREDIVAGKRDFFNLYKDDAPTGGLQTRITIPQGELNTQQTYDINVKDFYNEWAFDTSDKIQNNRSTLEFIPIDAGFNFNLVAHEILHSFLGWTHPLTDPSNNGVDLVYHTAAAISVIVNGYTNNQSITANIPAYQSSNERHTSLNMYLGEHLPMAANGFFQQEVYMSYNVLSQYFYNQLNRQVYNPLARGQTYIRFTAKPGDVRSVPNNPFEGITWNGLTYSGLSYY